MRQPDERVPRFPAVDVGVDVGGTFTDFVGFRGRDVVTTKRPSTRDPSVAVLAGLRELRADRMAHGMTVATNAILERRGARTAFVTTAGFEDLLTIGRQDRPSLYDLRVPRPPPAVPRERCIGVRERVDARGRPLLRVSRAETARVARLVETTGAESVAVCLLFSFLRPAHERTIARALRGLPVSTSHEVLPEVREVERASTTVLDAYVKPLVTRYLTDLGSSLGPFLVMKSDGGVAAHAAVARRPVEVVLSGPAGGVAGVVALGRRLRLRNLVAFDMGGTSADFSAILSGRPSWTTEASIDGFPLALPVVDIESVGAGGGSLAWRDAGGALRVGPRSAGADPGPVAYGRGGTQATVTDADLCAGALGPALLGGALPLHVSLARKATEALADGLGVRPHDAVLGVQAVVRANMAAAMRLVLSKRGLDPRDFALVAFGGAGPMHAVALAREMAVPRVLVPFLPGAFSAYGILISDVRVEYGRSVVRPLARAAGLLHDVVDAFTARGRADLAAQGFDPAEAAFEASADLRFRGQSYEINVPLRGDLAAAFRRAHRLRYGYASATEPIEVVTVRVVGRVPRRAHVPTARREGRPRSGTRRLLTDEGWVGARTFDRSTLPVGFAADGPAIVEEDHATTVVPTDASFRVGRLGVLDIEVGP
jgi:N-methylhydantoinase A